MALPGGAYWIPRERTDDDTLAHDLLHGFYVIKTSLTNSELVGEPQEKGNIIIVTVRTSASRETTIALHSEA